MKTRFTILLLLSLVFLGNTHSSLGQEEELFPDQKITVYKEYEDYVNQNGEFLGELEGISQSVLGFKLRYYKGDKVRSRAINTSWGFTVGPYLFRFKRGRWNSPMLVQG